MYLFRQRDYKKKKKFLPTGKVGLMKHARADANYAILTKQVKL